MNHFSRLGTLTIIVAGAFPLLHPIHSSAQIVNVLQDSLPYLLHGSSQGYLGVTIHDVDNDRAVALKLKDARGAEIVTVDHDAPAGKAGLQAQDVILQMNGQVIDGAEQLRRMLREIPAGRSVTLVIGRDGQQLNITAKLVDRKVLDHEAWGQHVDPPPAQEAIPALGFDQGGTGARGFVDAWSFGGGNPSIGAVVDPLGAQLANYFGVTEGVGLLVRSVDHKSPAGTAGLKAGDVVLKVNDDTMATRADWLRVLRANQGKQVQVTVIRDKKQQLLTMQAGNLKKRGALELPGLCDLESQEMVAELRGLPEVFQSIDSDAIAAQARAAIGNIDVDAIRKQAEAAVKSIDTNALREQLNQLNQAMKDDGTLREQMQQAQDATKNIDVDAIRNEAEQAMKGLDVDAIRAQVDQSAKQIETMKKQLQEMKQQFQQALPPFAH